MGKIKDASDLLLAGMRGEDESSVGRVTTVQCDGMVYDVVATIKLTKRV